MNHYPKLTINDVVTNFSEQISPGVSEEKQSESYHEYIESLLLSDNITEDTYCVLKLMGDWAGQK